MDVVIRPPASIQDRVAHGLDGLIVSQMMKLAPDETESADLRLAEFREIQQESEVKTKALSAL